MKFRPDLEGLRGIAVALVVLFHFDLLGARGGFVGVDAFYVLSGFLITSLLLRELSQTGGIDLVAFYARRARRILPAATAALVLVLAAAVLVVAPLDQPTIAFDATACGLFACNITFALRATDYFASQTPSPFLHYWSLGVEEQFYLVWPFLLLLAFRCRRPQLLVASLCLVSFGIALALTEAFPTWAFFALPSRAWQLGAGALLALYAPSIERMPALAAGAIGWTGLALLALVAATLDHTAPYPGVAALAPTAAVAMVIASGARRGGPVRALSVPPLRWLGRISFSLYLYHWPVFVLGTLVVGDLSVATRWALVGCAVLLAAASRAFVEEPFMAGWISFRARGRPFAFAIGTVALVLVTAQLVGVSAASSVERSAPADAAQVVAVVADAPQELRLPSPPSSATATSASATPAPVPTQIVPRELRPRIADARKDTDGLNERGCGLSLAGDRPPLCDLGDAQGIVTVALVGDSHAAQWYPALDEIAGARHWRVVPFTKDSCIFLDMRIVSIHLEREYTECARWRTNVVDAVRRLRPDLVVISSSRWVHPVDARDDDPARQAEATARLAGVLGARVALIADTPLMSQDVPACLSRRDRTAQSCGTSREYALTRALARDGRAAELSNATLIDPSLWLCDDASCPAVIDQTIVYRDDHHLTATMARRLAALLEPGLLEALARPSR